ncbi:Acyltransferase OS=Streptomyces antimycoticus OX=68175 GN=SSPO_013610 PE=4 SV=1 [Streptomyces antimycoticus]
MSTVSTTLTTVPAAVRRPVNGTPAKGAPSGTGGNAETRLGPWRRFHSRLPRLAAVFRASSRRTPVQPVRERGHRLFFVLSALSADTLTHGQQWTGARPAPGRVFLFRRAIRIIPLYFLAVLCVWATRNPTLPGEWSDLVHHLTFTQVFDRGADLLHHRRLVVVPGNHVLSGAGGTRPLAARACRPLRKRASRWRCAPPDVPCCTSGGSSGSRSARAGDSAYRMGLLGPQARFGGFAAGHGPFRRDDGRPRRPGPAPVAIPLRVAALLGLSVPGPVRRGFPHHLLPSAVRPAVDAAAVHTMHVQQQGRWHRWLTVRWLSLRPLRLGRLGLYNAGLLPTRRPGRASRWPSVTCWWWPWPPPR